MYRLPLWWLLVGCALASCGKAHAPTGPAVDSETHFLTLCTQSCGDGLSCVCGVCTTSCAVDADCRELNEAASCAEPRPGDAPSCEADAPELVCDVSCKRDGDCASLGEDHVCDQGACRKPALATDTPTAPTELPYARGGHRLKALHYVADGVEQFRNLHDSELDFDCEFAPDATGNGVHCVPSAVREVIYLDSECKQPATAIQAAEASQPGTQPGDWLSALLTEPAPTCSGAPAARRVSYRIGERVFEGGIPSIGMTPPTVYAVRDAKCAEAEVQFGLLLPAIYRIEPQDQDQLVAGRVTTIAVGGGLSVRRVTADDDTRITIGIVGLGAMPCSVQLGGVCVPTPITTESGGFFLDAACEQPAFWSMTTTPCAEPEFGVRMVDDSAHVYELTAAKTVFTKNLIDPMPPPGMDFEYRCDSVPLDSLEPAYASKVWMPANDVTATLPSAATLKTGPDTLHLSRYVAMTPTRDADHFVALDGGGPLLDEHGRTCQIRAAVDGTLRCLADDDRVREADYWKDLGCNNRLYTTTDSTVDSSQLRIPHWQSTDATKLETLSALVPYDGPTFQVVQTQCVAATSASPTLLLMQDTEIPVTTLPSVESAEL